MGGGRNGDGDGDEGGAGEGAERRAPPRAARQKGQRRRRGPRSAAGTSRSAPGSGACRGTSGSSWPRPGSRRCALDARAMSGNGALHFLTETLGWRFLFALLLSIALWARLTLEQNPERRDLYPTDIPVEASGLSPGLVVANEVQPVRLRISAPSQSWRTLEPGSFRAQVDLSGVTPGLVQRDVAGGGLRPRGEGAGGDPGQGQRAGGGAAHRLRPGAGQPAGERPLRLPRGRRAGGGARPRCRSAGPPAPSSGSPRRR